MKVKHIASAILAATFVAACSGPKNTVPQELTLKDAVGDQFLRNGSKCPSSSWKRHECYQYCETPFQCHCC